MCHLAPFRVTRTARVYKDAQCSLKLYVHQRLLKWTASVESNFTTSSGACEDGTTIYRWSAWALQSAIAAAMAAQRSGSPRPCYAILGQCWGCCHEHIVRVQQQQEHACSGALVPYLALFASV